MEIEEAVFTSVSANFPQLPISFPGVNFVTPASGLWLELILFRNEPANQPISNAKGIDQGIIQISACARPGSGMLGVRNLANSLISTFPKGHSFLSYHRIINNPYMLSIIINEQNIMLPVSFSYSA